MSDTDGFAGPIENETIQTKKDKCIKLTPLYQQFTHKIVALLVTIIVMIGLTLILFYQNKIQHSALVETQLIPLTQELKQIKALQKADVLIANLLISANSENFVELHSELIAANRQLLQQRSSNEQVFQQWLNESKLAEDIVSRIQDSHTHNQQLKQSSIIQLQLMIFSITSIIESELASQKLKDLQQLKTLLVEVLLGFEQLNMNTPIATFERLRIKVEQAFSQQKNFKGSGSIQAMVEVNQQFDAFEKIVLTEQRSLPKWQGYIRLVQDYQLDLKAHQKKIRELLLTPYKYNQDSEKGIVYGLLTKLNIELSNKNIITILIIAICLSLLFSFYVMLRLREQIKVSTRESVELIQSTLQTQDGSIVANCLETQEIMNHVRCIAKPQHNEDEFQELLTQYRSNQQLLEQEKQKIAQLSQCNEQQQLNSKEQITEHINNDLLCYHLLEKTILPIIQQHQLTCLNLKKSSENDVASVASQLTSLRQQLSQFQLALEVKLDRTVLNLSDINLVDEIHAILFNKQQEQQSSDNQLFTSFDEQLLKETKIDFRLFQQLISLFIDISLTHCEKSQLCLHLQLKDKNAGQQLVQFTAKIKVKSLNTLPTLITQLVDSQSTLFDISPLIEVFNTLFAKLHGENIVAQLVDDGYQLNFELPLAIANSTSHADKFTLENITVMLLSTNTVLTELIEKIVLSAKGKFERLVRIDSFQQQLTVKHLNRRKLDLLVISSDVASNHFDLITQQINELPFSLRPKLMVLQSEVLNYERFGFYSQAEQVFCKDTFLDNIVKLLANNESNNRLVPSEPFIANQYVATELPLLLGVQSPQQHQNLRRLLHWLGLQVQVVSHEAAQEMLWKTGQYSLLITEFAETSLLKMTSKPLVNIGVFSLTDVIPQSDNDPYFENWSVGKLKKESKLTDLIDVLAPWLRQTHDASKTESNSDELALQVEHSDGLDELVITEIADVLTEKSSYAGNEAVFDFSQYLQHQGTVELALFMLDDYTQDNHQQLDALIEAIKTKKIEEARLSISALALNAKILSAHALQSLCTKWSELLSGSGTSISLKKVNSLIKDTQIVLNKIDEYAGSI